MAEFTLNFEQLPDNAGSGNIDKGKHKLTIKEAKIVKATTGSTMLQLSHTVDDTNFQINFDNYVIVDKDLKPNAFGQAKLKKLLEAIKVKPAGNFTLNILPQLINGKSFLVDLDYAKDKDGNQSKYLSICDIESYEPIEETNVNLQQQIAIELDEEDI